MALMRPVRAMAPMSLAAVGVHMCSRSSALASRGACWVPRMGWMMPAREGHSWTADAAMNRSMNSIANEEERP